MDGARLPLRIAYVCQYFVPEPAAPAARVHEMSRAWVKAGDEVTVVTGFPNHPTGEIPPGYQGKIATEEKLDGIRVLRNWLYARPAKGVGNRGLAQLTFMVTAVLLGLPRLGAVDVVIASSPTLFSAVSGWVIAALKRVPFVMEVRDLWPDAFAEIGVMQEGLSVRALRWLARFLYQRADLIVVVTEAFADRLVDQGVSRRKIVCIPNGADTVLFAPRKDGGEMRRALGLPQDQFLVGYLGSHGISQGLDVVLETAALLPDVQFALVGDGSEKPRLQAEAERRGLSNVHFRPSVLKGGVPRLYAAVDVCLVPLKPVAIFEAFVPSKLFEVLAAGRPTVGVVQGEARSILERSGGGLLVEPGDAVGVAAAVTRLQAEPDLGEQLGERGRAFIQDHYDRDRLAERYLRLLHGLAARA